MNNSFIYSIQQSGIVGQIILLILLLLSILSWGIIIQKLLIFKKLKEINRLFLTRYQKQGYKMIHSPNIQETYKKSPLFNILFQSYEKISLLSQQENISQKYFLDNVIEIIKENLNTEIKKSNYLIFILATISSVSPFFGLLGTVWGIMNAFRSMGIVGAASIGTVAPGIAEALITTVVGLIVAIPALIGYNYFSNEIAELTVELEEFSSRLFNTIKQSL